MQCDETVFRAISLNAKYYKANKINNIFIYFWIGSGSDHSKCGECVEESTTENTPKSSPTTQAVKANTEKTKSIKNVVSSKTKALSDRSKFN